MLAAIACPLAVWAVRDNIGWAIHLAPLAALLIFLHRDNIARLRAGTESKIGQKAT